MSDTQKQIIELDQMKTTQQSMDQLDVMMDALDVGNGQMDGQMDDSLSMEDMHNLASSAAHQKVEQKSERCQHLGLMFVMCLSMLSFLPLMIFEGLREKDGKNKGLFQKIVDEWLTDDHAVRVVLVGHLMFLPFACPVMIYLLWHVERVVKQGRPSKFKVCAQAIALTVVVQLRVSVGQCFKPTYQSYMNFYIEFALWLTSLSIWYSVIKDVLARGLGYLKAFDDVITSHAPYQKQLSIMLSFTKFHDNKGKNAIYSFKKPNTACQVLEMYMEMYYAAFRTLPAMGFVMWYFGIAISTNFVGVAILAMGGSAVAFFTIGMKNLLSIVVSKPFYLGDIIEVGAIIGFVENFTWSHIVIRDFGCKQVWIAHSTFEGQTISNWTRRNTKPILVQFSMNAFTSPNVVQEFVAEALQSVKANTKVNQKGYIKVCISSMASGYVLTALFFPGPGQQKKIVREGYLLDVMRIAAQKKIEIVPLAIVTSFAKGASAPPIQTV